jgi:purine-binding chemotaxis protein CheW
MGTGSAPTGVSDRSSARDVRAQLQFVGFQIDGTDYAIPIMSIREIILMRPITRIPQVPPYIEGLINLRGLVIPIVNLRTRFGLESRPFGEETRTIVTSLGEKTVGCIVDAVTRVMRIDTDQIQPAPAAMTPQVRRFVSGLAQLEDRLLVLLDLQSLLEADAFELPDALSAQPEDRPATTA